MDLNRWPISTLILNVRMPLSCFKEFFWKMWCFSQGLDRCCYSEMTVVWNVPLTHCPHWPPPPPSPVARSFLTTLPKFTACSLYVLSPWLLEVPRKANLKWFVEALTTWLTYDLRWPMKFLLKMPVVMLGKVVALTTRLLSVLLFAGGYMSSSLRISSADRIFHRIAFPYKPIMEALVSLRVSWWTLKTYFGFSFS